MTSVTFKVKNVAGSIVNPATEDTLALLNAHLANIDTDSLAIVTTSATTAINTAALGAKTDSVATDDTGAWSVPALLKRLLAYFSRDIVVPSALGVNSFNTEEGTAIPTNAAPWSGTRENCGTYVRQDIIFDRLPLTAFGVVKFTYAKRGTGTAAIDSLTLPVTAGQPFIPKGLRNVGVWFKVDFVPDVASPPITYAQLTTNNFRKEAGPLTRFLNQVLTNDEPITTVQAVGAAEYAGALGTYDNFLMNAKRRLLAVPTSGNYAGVSNTGTATVNVPAGAVVRSFSAVSGQSNATISVPGVTGVVTLPGSNQVSTEYSDNPDPDTMIGPCTFIFTNCAAYSVTWVA